MRIKTTYLTRDNREFSTIQGATSHNLSQSTVWLKNVLENAGIENPHAYATKIVNNCISKKNQGTDDWKALVKCFEHINDAMELPEEN